MHIFASMHSSGLIWRARWRNLDQNQERSSAVCDARELDIESEAFAELRWAPQQVTPAEE
jgi:hypothetical protein